MGIEIQQTVFSFNLNENNLPDEKIYVRYRIINRGNVNSVLDSVIFSFYLDPDIGDYSNDLIACDTLLNLGYAYSYGDSEFGINPPATGIALVQGPPVYIKDKTFLDNNNDNIFQSDIDIPIDTAVFKSGKGISSVILPGAKNQNITSYYSVIIDNFPIIRDPYDKYDYRGWQNSLFYNTLFNPCNYPFGIVLGPHDCSQINPLFLFSGDPVLREGWLFDITTDVRFMLSTGQFTLKKDEPVDIWGVYVAGRGEDSLQSITKMKENTLSAHRFYDQLPINEERTPPPVLPSVYKLYQNYPNPFNPVTKIRYNIPSVISTGGRNLKVTLKVYDILGREITTLVNEEKPSGSYEVEFNGSKYASGVYFYQLKTGNYLETKKMILIK